MGTTTLQPPDPPPHTKAPHEPFRQHIKTGEDVLLVTIYSANTVHIQILTKELLLAKQQGFRVTFPQT